MIGKTWVCESGFSTVNFMKSKYQASISKENLAYELRWVLIVKYKPGFWDLTWKKES